MDLFTQAEKTEYSNYFNDIHDTFARPIFMFKKRDELVITDNPNHSYVWDAAPMNTETVSTLVSGIFNARILYSTKQEKGFLLSKSNQDQIGTADTFEGDVRIKLDPTGAAFIGDSQRVKFDGFLFDISSNPRPHGLFTPKWETFYLKRTN